MRKLLILLLLIFIAGCEENPTGPKEETFRISGKVVGWSGVTDNFEPVEGITINLEGYKIKKSCTTDKNGLYSFKDLPSGSYVLIPDRETSNSSAVNYKRYIFFHENLDNIALYSESIVVDDIQVLNADGSSVFTEMIYKF